MTPFMSTMVLIVRIFKGVHFVWWTLVCRTGSKLLNTLIRFLSLRYLSHRFIHLPSNFETKRKLINIVYRVYIYKNYETKALRTRCIMTNIEWIRLQNELSIKSFLQFYILIICAQFFLFKPGPENKLNSNRTKTGSTRSKPNSNRRFQHIVEPNSNNVL